MRESPGLRFRRGHPSASTLPVFSNSMVSRALAILQGVSVAFVFLPTSDVVRNVDGVIPRNSGTFYF